MSEPLALVEQARAWPQSRRAFEDFEATEALLAGLADAVKQLQDQRDYLRRDWKTALGERDEERRWASAWQEMALRKEARVASLEAVVRMTVEVLDQLVFSEEEARDEELTRRLTVTLRALLDSEESQPPVYAEMSLEELIEHAGQRLGDKFKGILRESIDDEVDRAVYEAERGEEL